jgi:predicted MPP superfamily phosphohydrolase
MIYQAYHDTLDYQTIAHESLLTGFEGFHILFISDIHRRVIRDDKLQSITVDMDIVIIGGDLTEKGVPSPSAFYDLETEEQAKLNVVLAGHTHGGQIRIFGFGLYPKGGYQLYNRTSLIVSEGYGCTRLPFRLGQKRNAMSLF